MKKLLLILAIMFTVFLATSQSVSINSTGAVADNSAILDISSTTKGLLIPRVNLVSLGDATTILSPATSLLVYNTNAVLGTGFYYNSGIPAIPSWIKIVAGPGASWTIGGNAASATDFIGTTNNTSLKFKVGNLPAGELNPTNYNTSLGSFTFYYNTTGTKSTAFGYASLYHNTSGVDNTAFGYGSLLVNNTGSQNTATGVNSLNANSTGSKNTGIGWGSLSTNSTGNENAAVGYNALTNNTGSYNCAIGSGALQTNTSGSHNNAIGDAALIGNSSGNYNNGLGAFALTSNTTGNNNTGLGDGALGSNTTGNNNIAVGKNALSSFSAGNNNIAIGSEALSTCLYGTDLVAIGDSALFNQINTAFYGSTAVGAKSLFNNITGAFNTATGIQALYNSTYGNNNSGFGTQSLLRNTTGGSNTAMGSYALEYNTTGNANTALGSDAGTTTGNLTFATAIGANAQVGASYAMALGGTGADQLKVAIGLQIPLSDFHIKQSNENYPVNGGGIRLERLTNTNHWEIGSDNGDDLDFVWNGASKGYLNHASGAYVTVSDIRTKKDIASLESVLPQIMQLRAKTYHYKDNDANAPLSYGFIAQEVEKVFPNFVKTKGKDDMKAIAYENFSVVAIKAIQEQQKVIEDQEKRLAALEQQVQHLMNK